MPIKKLDLGRSFKELPIRFSRVACVNNRIKASTEKTSGLFAVNGSRNFTIILKI